VRLHKRNPVGRGIPDAPQWKHNPTTNAKKTSIAPVGCGSIRRNPVGRGIPDAPPWKHTLTTNASKNKHRPLENRKHQIDASKK